MNDRWWLVVGIAAVMGLGIRARVHPAPHAPALRDPVIAEPWMIDALPGVGDKRLADALAAVRSERFAELHKPARDCADKVFSPGPGDLDVSDPQ